VVLNTRNAKITNLIDNNGNVVSAVNSIALEGCFVINLKWIGVFPIVRLLINAT